MADDSFRPYRRDPFARSDAVPRDGSGGDPLAELARIIGQSESQGGQAVDTRLADTEGDARQGGLDWAAGGDGYAERDRDTNEGYPPLRAAESYPSAPSAPPRGGSWPHDANDYERDRRYEDEPAPPASKFAGAPPPFRDPRDDLDRDVAQDARNRSDPRPAASRPQPASYIPAATEDYPPQDRQKFAERAPAYGDEFPQNQYQYDEEAPPRRRNGTVIILAAIGLAVLGTAGAFGYRAMFGTALPSLPPIIKPAAGPIKIEPKHDAQGGAANPADVASGGSGDHVVTHQEQPVDLPPASPPPRVITTIPVISNPPNVVSGAASPALPGTASAPPSASPPPPPGPAATRPSAPVGLSDQLSGPSSVPGGSKEVQTLTIRPGQPQPNAAQPSAATHAAKPRDVAREPAVKPRRHPTETAAGGPLSIVPVHDQANETPPARMAMAHPPRSVAPGPAPTGTSRPTGGSYEVQVSSQRSEAEAQASFRSLQGKYPAQLGGHQPIVRRADLGARGIYYRALVGPFASSDQAAQLCSSLKAAGANCIIQRN